MKAVVKTAPGFDHMKYMEVKEPKAEGDLVKIKVAYSRIQRILRKYKDSGDTWS